MKIQTQVKASFKEFGLLTFDRCLLNEKSKSSYLAGAA
jgi:hypothetical protein